jgi:hypothetical protein
MRTQFAESLDDLVRFFEALAEFHYFFLPERGGGTPMRKLRFDLAG